MTSIEDSSWDVVVVGGGAAGLSAALILARARRRVLVLDGAEPRNRFAPHMHGVLSRDGYSPFALTEDGRREVRAAGGIIETAVVSSVARHGSGFELVTDRGARIQTSRLVIATGIRDELPRIPGLASQWGRGAVACPYCDGYEARDLRIGVLLGALAGQHKAQLLRAYSPDITVLTGLSGDLTEDESRALSARGIRIDRREISAVAAKDGVLSGVEFADGSRLLLDRLFVDPRMIPLDDLLRQLDVERTETPAGLWTATDATGQTSVPGLYAIGNVADPSALVPIAAAAGVAAATNINASLVTEDVAAALAAFDLEEAS